MEVGWWWIKQRTMMTFEKWVIPVPIVCVIEQVAALLPGEWNYQGGGQEELEKGGWLFRVGAVHHAVRKCCRHQAPSQICVWNPRSIRMGSTIKRNKDTEKRVGGTKKEASNGAVHESEKCFHICGYGCCQIQTITQQDVRSSHFTKRLWAVYESTILHGDQGLKVCAMHNSSYL